MNLAGKKSFTWNEVAIIPLSLSLFCLFVFFYNLGGPALFEPTEGRNAEIAREILITHDWVTPHDNFVPVLDKPIFLHWLIAFCYTLFGVSEWSARLPSALAGLGSVMAVYLFARKFLGLWEALWSGVVLTSSVQFYALSRIVIFDMALCFSVTLALCAFYWGAHTDRLSKKRAFYLLMYAALGVATLIKGPIGLFLPGMVILFYLLTTRRWSLLREMEMFGGALLFIAIVFPWYVLAEMKNPGYLYYFLLEENLVRFFTAHFNRSAPLYYFFAVLAVGFFPWTFLFPYLIKTFWNAPKRDVTLFLFLWTGLPLFFFSFSHAKLSHYILPVYPPLAILAGTALARGHKQAATEKRWPLWFPAVNLFLMFCAVGIGVYWPTSLPQLLQGAVSTALREVPGSLLFVLLLGTVWFALSTSRHLPLQQITLYVLCCSGFALQFFFSQAIVPRVSLELSSKRLAEQLASLVEPGNQLVVYDHFRSSLPFYLKIERPIWVVSAKDDHSIMESYYAAEKRPQPAAVYGQALFPLEEFPEIWGNPKTKLLVLLKEKNLRRLVGPYRKLPEIMLRVNEYVLVTNRGFAGQNF